MRSKWTLYVGNIPPILLVEDNLEQALVENEIRCLKVQLRSNPYNAYANGFAFLQFTTEREMLESKTIIESTEFDGGHTLSVKVAFDRAALDDKVQPDPVLHQHLNVAPRSRFARQTNNSDSEDTDSDDGLLHL